MLWGSQWNNNDPSGESTILQNFYNGVGGSSWLNSVTQYCQGVASGAVFCNGAGTPAGNQKGMLIGVWADNGNAAPSKPRQSQRQQQCERTVRNRHRDEEQLQRIWETILRVAQLDEFVGRQRRLH